MNLAKPIFRLLLACFMLFLAPIVAGTTALPAYWLAIPVLVLTYVSCAAQGYAGPKLVALVTLSITSMILALYGASYLLVRMWLAGGVS